MKRLLTLICVLAWVPASAFAGNSEASSYEQIVNESIVMAYTDSRFDPELWKNTEVKQRGKRVGMVDDLLARYSLTEKTRAEIVALLGPPEQTTYFSDWDMAYWLGPERSFGSVDSEWLVLRVGPEDRVLELRVVTD